MESIKQIATHAALILVVAGSVLFANLGATRLWDRDEPRNAGCAREMLDRNDWVTPYFDGQLRKAKPVLLYWLIMSAYAVFGENEFAARFWSACFGTGTVFLIYFIGRRLFSPNAAIWGAIILATSLMFDVASRAATPDSTLIFLTTSAIAVYVAAAFRKSDELGDSSGVRTAIRFWPAVGIYGLMGLGVLAKGPVGLVLPTAVIGMFLLMVRLPQQKLSAEGGEQNPSERTVITRLQLWFRQVLRPFHPVHFFKTCWVMRPLTAILVVLAVALPWYVWVGVRTQGEWLRGFLLDENIGRAMQPLENHRGPFFYYLIAVTVGFFPWSIYLLPVTLDTFRAYKRRIPWTLGYTLLLSWIGVYLGIFSAAQTKLPSYVTPMYPALALLTGCFMERWRAGAANISEVWTRVSLGVLASVGLVLLAVLPVVAHIYLPGEEWLGVIGLIPLVGSGLAAFWLRSDQRGLVCHAVAVTAFVFTLSLFGLATLRVDHHQRNHELLAAINAHSHTPVVGSFGCLEPSWVFYGGRPIVELTAGAESHEASTDSTIPRPTGLSNFLTKNDSFVILPRRIWEQVRDQLPSEVEVIAESPYFLKKDSLLVISRGTDTFRTGADSETANQKQYLGSDGSDRTVR